MGEFVYFFREHGTQNFKIGKTYSDINSRISALQIGNSRKITLFGYLLCDDCLEVENKFHKRFDKNRIQGEWFDISESELVSYIKSTGIKFFRKLRSVHSDNLRNKKHSKSSLQICKTMRSSESIDWFRIEAKRRGQKLDSFFREIVTFYRESQKDSQK